MQKSGPKDPSVSKKKRKPTETADNEPKKQKVEIEAVVTKTDKKKKRKYRGKKKSKSSTTNPARLPVPNKAETISSNWEKLKAELPPTTKKKFVPSRSKVELEPFKDSKVEETKKNPDLIWFDDVDENLLDPEDLPSFKEPKSSHDKDQNIGDGLVKERGFKGLTKVIGIDCEMVGVGYKSDESILARISLVNHFGHCVYDKFVKPREKVTDYRTAVSGIRPNDIKNGSEFKEVQAEVSKMLNGRILVGHSLKHDLKVLFLDHPKRMIRDTSTYKPFRNAFGGRTPSLKNLSERMLGVKVQEGEHSSVQDAQAAVRLYTMFRREWEASLDEKRKKEIFFNSKKGKKMSEDVNTNIKLQLSSSYNVVVGKKEIKKNKLIVKKSHTNCPLYQDSDSD